jgi:short-subunit dehydrogenase
MTSYSASKFGVVGFSEVLRWELAARGVGVTVVCPGIVRTDISKAEGAGLALVDLEDVLRRAPAPEPLARKIVRAVLRDNPRVIYGLEARLFVALRLLPYHVLDTLGCWTAAQMKKAMRQRTRPSTEEPQAAPSARD